MWLCGITACLLTIEGVKQRTTFFPFPALHHHQHHPQAHSKLLLQRKSCRSCVEGQQNRLLSQPVSGQGWIWGGGTPPHPHLCVCVSPHILLRPSLSSLSLCLFFIERKAETCWVCFSPSLGPEPTFKAQVLVSRESSFRKTRGGSPGHGGGVEGRGGEGGWRGWILTSPQSWDFFFFFIYQTGWTVSKLPVKSQKHILLCWLNLSWQFVFPNSSHELFQNVRRKKILLWR